MAQILACLSCHQVADLEGLSPEKYRPDGGRGKAQTWRPHKSPKGVLRETIYRCPSCAQPFAIFFTNEAGEAVNAQGEKLEAAGPAKGPAKGPAPR
jgi:hypothetical protein